MKAAFVFLLIFLCACKPQPKTITVSFNGWHANTFLTAACVPLNREHDRVNKMSAKEQVALMYYSSKHFMPCLFEPDSMNRGVENKLMSEFASNPQCQGVSFYQGFYDPKTDATTEAGKQFTRADWRLYLDLIPSPETGEVSLPDSQWTVTPKSLSGSLADIRKASTNICTIVKGQGGKI